MVRKMIAKNRLYNRNVALRHKRTARALLPVASRGIVREGDETDDDGTHCAAQHGDPETHMVVLEEVDRHGGIQARRLLRHDDVCCDKKESRLI